MQGSSTEVAGVRPARSTDGERAREAALLGRGQAIDERINRMLSVKALTHEQEKILESLRQQASEIRRQLIELDGQLEAKYGVLASRTVTLEEARKALSEETATPMETAGSTRCRTGGRARCATPANPSGSISPAPGRENGVWT